MSENERVIVTMLYPSIDSVKKLLKEYPTVPVFALALTDCATPVGIFSLLKGRSENCFLLESVGQSERWGRYSFIGINPKAQIVIQNGKATVTCGENCRAEQIDSPVEFLNRLLAEFHSPHFPGYPRLTGGFAGYFGYDMLRYLEPSLGNPPHDDLGMPDCVLHRYDEMIAFDHLNGKSYAILQINNKSDVEEQYRLCNARAEELLQIISSAPPSTPAQKTRVNPTVTVNVTKQEFISRVEKAKSYIRAGEIFQVVPSRRFEVENSPDAFSVYRVLRSTNPSPYLYYFQAPDYQICGASPEMLVRVEGGA
ncbi:MAG TPA: chorismate-binding protein, partial [Clostridia bacterium]|nr:chorismate-binding protein [Clostridia bacterium]